MLDETYKNNCIFDWAYVIQNELPFQLHILPKRNGFFMMSYLITLLVSRHVFDRLLCNPIFKFREEIMQLLYPILWKHEASLNFCLIQDVFMMKVYFMVNRQEPSQISTEAEAFLLHKGEYEERESNKINHRLYCLPNNENFSRSEEDGQRPPLVSPLTA